MFVVVGRSTSFWEKRNEIRLSLADPETNPLKQARRSPTHL